MSSAIPVVRATVIGVLAIAFAVCSSHGQSGSLSQSVPLANARSLQTLSPQAVHASESPFTPRDRFGRMRVVAWPLYLALRFVYTRVTGNWGSAIVLVTALFNLVMILPRVLSLKSSAKMARLQPKVEAIRKRHSNAGPSPLKQAEMNNEIMELYKEDGVSVLGGCFPMLLQMPLLFGLFSVFRNAVELSGTGWMWLADLAKPDPLHILPVIIVGTMLLTQLITPSPGMGVAQRRAMAIIIALIFGVGLASYASGLALYWAIGNVINLIVQFAINKTKLGKEIANAAPARRIS